ncbi:hypothetical protein ACFPJ1_24250 [Kribbella qitaiheensis]|uniref:hypothetical protein n=1 Tax=Kribbella qitaiheensis TaxID=1544730 RepID=UPI00360F3A46
MLFDLIDPDVWYLADFLTPAPQSAVPDLATDRSAIRRVSAERVRADLEVLAYARTHPIGSLEEASVPRRLRSARTEDLPTEAVADLYADPAAGISPLADQVEAYWELAMPPHWGRIRASSKGMCSTAGGDWGRACRFVRGSRRVRQLARRGSAHIKQSRFKGVRNLSGEGLLMTPSAFVWPMVYSSTIPPMASAGVSAVQGRSRAELLAQLDTPRSTTDLARRTGLTAGGVSQHWPRPDRAASSLLTGSGG